MQRLTQLQQKVQKKKAKSEKLGANLALELSLVKQQLGLEDIVSDEPSGVMSPKRKREEIELTPSRMLSHSFFPFILFSF